MIGVGGQIEGLEELARNSSKLRKSFLGSTLRTALRNGVKPVRTLARAKVPTASGDLKRAIKSKAKVFRSGFGRADVGFERERFYGGFQELGTSSQPARPFLRPALKEAHTSGAINQAFVAALNKTIARTLGRLGG